MRTTTIEETTSATVMNQLSDENLRIVAGGMDCQTALGLAYSAAAVACVLKAAGDTVGAANWNGYANGLIQGGCGA